MPQGGNRRHQLQALEADEVSQAAGSGGGLGDAVRTDGRGRAFNVVHHVVHALSERGDVLTVKRRNEGLVHLSVDLVGDLVGLVLQVP